MKFVTESLKNNPKFTQTIKNGQQVIEVLWIDKNIDLLIFLKLSKISSIQAMPSIYFNINYIR